MQGIKNLTQGPINRQLFNLAMPIMATSFIQMAYSLTDMAWVGRLGSEAVAAIGSVGILTWMSGSISLLNKVGSEVSVGQSIGAQSQEDAKRGTGVPYDPSETDPDGKISSFASPLILHRSFLCGYICWIRT